MKEVSVCVCLRRGRNPGYPELGSAEEREGRTLTGEGRCGGGEVGAALKERKKNTEEEVLDPSLSC